MGIPVSLKDLFTVDGMPVTVGSKMDISDLVEPEGSLVKTLKSAGCIILGKTKQTELSLAINLKHSAPWNPCDPHTKRISGASSNGSAVALAAGLSAFTIGSDAGGSVRQPASLNGVFGYKATTSYLPTDGGFPLSTTMDSIGIFANSARDAATILGALTDRGPPETQTVKGLRLGKPANHFFEDLHPMVEACVDKALAALEQAGRGARALQHPRGGGNRLSIGGDGSGRVDCHSRTRPFPAAEGSNRPSCLRAGERWYGYVGHGLHPNAAAPP